MKQFLFIIFFLIFQNIFGQFAIIQDKDGFVNVREEPISNSKVTDTVYNGEIVYYSECWGEIKDNWYPIGLEQYVHKSRLKFFTDFENIPIKQKTKDMIVFQRNEFKLTLTVVPFGTKGNKFSYRKKIRPKENPYLEMINGKKIWGADGWVPITKYGQSLVQIGNEKISLPSENLFDPNIYNTKVFYDNKSETYYINASNSDGVAAYETLWIIEKNKYKKIIVISPL